jgi:hypothetical protein
MMMVQKNDVSHPVDVALNLFTAAGLEEYLNIPSFTAAKADLPIDQVGCRFEDTTVAAALAALGKNCLYRFINDFSKFKLLPYLGVPPAAAALILDNNEAREITPTIDMDESTDVVRVKWAWYERNPALTYLAGDASSSQVTILDFTWESPVATESEAMARQKADWGLKRRRYGREILDPVRASLRPVRLELGDGVELRDNYLLDTAHLYELKQKTISPYHTTMQLVRFLGE